MKSNLANATIELLALNANIVNLTSSKDLLPVSFAKKTFKLVNLLDLGSRFTTYSDEDFPGDFQKFVKMNDQFFTTAEKLLDKEAFKVRILGIQDVRILPNRSVLNH